MKWLVTEKVKTINNKYEQSKAQYNLDKQASKISLLSSGSVGKYELLKDEDILPKKKTVRKTCYNQENWKTKEKKIITKKRIGKAKWHCKKLI